MLLRGHQGEKAGVHVMGGSPLQHLHVQGVCLFSHTPGPHPQGPDLPRHVLPSHEAAPLSSPHSDLG